MTGDLSYIELHARSAFSFLRSSAAPEALVDRAAALGLPALAVTDRAGVYGSARVHQRARQHGLRALVGAELPMEDGSALPVLVINQRGYQTLCSLLTDAHLRSSKGQARLRWEELEGATDDWIVLGGDADEGPLALALRQGGVKAAAERLGTLLRHVPKSRLWIEIQRHQRRGEDWRNRCLLDLAEAHGLGAVATQAPCYLDTQGRRLVDAFTCLRHHTHLDQAGTLLEANDERCLRSPPSMRRRFADLPRLLDNTLRVAGQLEFSLTDLGYQFPRHPLPPGTGAAELLRRETYRGARRRYGRLTARVRAQLDHELALIGKLGFCGYFLIVWDLVNFTRREGILCQGRGSAANSAVCYSLGITAVDPIGGNLLFERFLSEGRNSWPDIDLDLPSGGQRERVIQEVFRRFAPRGAAMTANVITYRGRSAMREMARVLNLPEDFAGRFSSLHGGGDFQNTLELHDQLRQAGLPAGHPRLPALAELFQAVQGLPRHLGQHSGGMIISDRGLDSIVPLENASMPGRVVVQWDKDDCEDLGIVKVDLLGLGMLAAIEDSLAMCAARGRPVDLATLPKDDEATFELMRRADTIGVFQIESRAQMATLPIMQPRCFYDVVIEAAIIRPGPIVGKLVHPYLNRRNGREPVRYIDERFRPALERTLGIPLFQEQVLRMAMIIADFSGSEAEELRRALSFNRSTERMDRVMAKLRAAMQRKGVEPAAQDEIVASIRSFALYGFPESHAISFALIAYASAWLKVHRTAEFYAGLLNAQPMGFYSPATLVKDARHRGLRVRHPCVCLSDWHCRVEDDRAIRLGLNQLRGLSRGTAARLVAARAEAPWQDLNDLIARARPDRAERRVLASSGALAALTGHRREALWQVEGAGAGEPDLLTGAGKVTMPAADNGGGGAGLGAGGGMQTGARQAVTGSPLAPMNPVERLGADYAALGLTTGRHPMSFLRPRLPGVHRAVELAHLRHGTVIDVAGLVICRQRPGTAKGHVFISLEDETGIGNVFVPAATYERFRLVIHSEPLLRVRGRVQQNQGVVSIYSLRIEGLPFAIALGAQSHDFH